MEVQTVKTHLKPFRNEEVSAYEFVVKRISFKEPAAIVSMSGIGKRFSYTALTDSNIPEGYKLKSLNAKSTEELKEFVTELESDKDKIVAIIKVSFNGDCSWFFDKLNSLRIERYTDLIPVTLASLSNVYKSINSNNKVLTKSIFILKPNDLDDCDLLFNDYESRYNSKIPQTVRDKIIELSGGHTGLCKNLFLLFADGKNIDISPTELIKDEGILCWLEELVYDLPKEKLDLLLGNNMSDKDEEFFIKFGYLKDREIFSPLFKEYLLKRKKIQAPVSRSNITLELSYQEAEIFEYLKSNAEKIVSRDDVAKIIWGENWLDRYSDWSIDQAIYKIRKKIKEHDLSHRIVTKKGRGFVYFE